MISHLPFSSDGAANANWTIYPAEFLSNVLRHGHYGVQLFLVISGFCIHLRWASSKAVDAKINFVEFWKRRFWRLYPTYLVAISITLLFAYIGGALAYSRATDLGLDLLSLLTQTQNLTGAAWRVGNGVFWSLALEEQLYLLYFPLLAMRCRWGWYGALIIIGLVNLTWLGVSNLVPQTWQAGWMRAAPAYWFPWALGALAVEAYVGRIFLPRWSSSLLLGIACCLLAILAPFSFKSLFVTVSFFFLIRFAVTVEGRLGQIPGWISPLLWLGTISYSVYLVHNLAFIASKRILLSMSVPVESILFLRLFAGIGAGWILYRLVERRTFRRGEARESSRAKRNSTGP